MKNNTGRICNIEIQEIETIVTEKSVYKARHTIENGKWKTELRGK